MNKTLLSAALGVALAFGAHTATASVTTEFDADETFVESNQKRPGANLDIPTNASFDLGTIAAGTDVGIAGRIVTGVDIWTFTVDVPWTISFVNLDLDANQGFDSSDIPGFSNNGDPTKATFVISDADGVVYNSGELMALQGGLLDGLHYAGVAGDFTLTIDGARRSPGATYDIGISAVPVPAAGLLFLTALGGAAAAYRRKQRKAS